MRLGNTFFGAGALILIFPFVGLAQSPPEGETAVGTADGQGTKLRAATWNLEWYPGLRPQPSLDDEIAAEKNLTKSLASLETDILCLQEVVSGRSLQRTLGAVSGYRINVISDFADAPLELAIVSRFSSIKEQSGMVSFTANGAVAPPRGFVWAALDIGEGDALLVYSIHLKSNRGDAEENYAMRQESAIQLTKHALETVERLKSDGFKRRVAVVVGGDFNSDPQNGKWEGDGTWSAFAKAGFQWTWEGVEENLRNSWVGNDRFPPTCFDHVMALPRDGISVGKARLLAPAVPAGDHLPVAVDLEW